MLRRQLGCVTILLEISALMATWTTHPEPVQTLSECTDWDRFYMWNVNALYCGGETETQQFFG